MIYKTILKTEKCQRSDEEKSPPWQQEQERQEKEGRDRASAPEVRATSASGAQNFSQLIQPDSTPVSGDYQYKSTY